MTLVHIHHDAAASPRAPWFWTVEHDPHRAEPLECGSHPTWREAMDAAEAVVLDVPLGRAPLALRALLVRLADEHHEHSASPACDAETTLRDWRDAGFWPVNTHACTVCAGNEDVVEADGVCTSCRMARERLTALYGAGGCPDGGKCHHECGLYECFRVHHAGPLSETLWKTWPPIVRATWKDGGVL